MAINIKNYVDISTTFPSANVAGRSFGGLVFTASEMFVNDDSSASLKAAKATYDGGGVCYLTLDEVGELFGKEKSATRESIYPASLISDEDSADEAAKYTDEYRFAVGYYGYISPTGRFASRLAFSKMLSGEKPIEAFERVNKITNLFGSFTFLSVAGSSSSSSGGSEDSDIKSLLEVSKLNSELDAKYLFVVNRVNEFSGDACTECMKFTAEKYEGTVFVNGGSNVSAYMPMAILASTDYNNGQVVNFMFKQFDTESPSVEDDKTYSEFNQAFVNFYGRTQTNGQTLDFYQRGFNTDGTDTAVYCNEMWFKSLCETSLMNLLTSRERLPADALGVDLVKLEVVDCCADAIRNGMFMQKELVAKDIRGIRELVVSTGGIETDVGSIEADVSTKGYSVYAYLDTMENTDKLGKEAEKVIKYYVFYGTADSVRYVKGNDILLK